MIPLARRALAVLAVASATVLTLPAPAAAQAPAAGAGSEDPVLQRIYVEGMTDRSQLVRLSQALMDSIGPRLMGTEGHARAVDWALGEYTAFGVPARVESYGTWQGWRRGYTHAELIAPRRRDLDATLLAYSPGTNGPVEGPVLRLPDLPDLPAYERWLERARGAFVLVSPPEPSCRPLENLVQFALPATVARIQAEGDSLFNAWSQLSRRASQLGVMARMDQPGMVAGILNSTWSAGFGVNKIQSGGTRNVPMLDVSCEDNGLLHRMAENEQGPRLRLDAEAERLPDVPAVNVVAELRGNELPNEYILLSAHFDSWDSASGATDNGTASVMMMEVMRILRAVDPTPRRTIVVGHWGGEEQGTNGSLAFAEDHPGIVNNIQIGFNQDNGTWRIEAIRMQGFSRAQTVVDRWLRQMPRDVGGGVLFTSPDAEGSSDHTSFTCRGAPVVRLQSNYPDYRQYTWHTNLDTFDKVVFDDLKLNATLTAMLVYLASEEPERISWERDPRLNAAGQPIAYPACPQARRAPPS